MKVRCKLLMSEVDQSVVLTWLELAECYRCLIIKLLNKIEYSVCYICTLFTRQCSRFKESVIYVQLSEADD